MIDIIGVNGDLALLDTDVKRAANILSTQIGQLEYAPDLGIDLEFFLDDRFTFENASFNAYLIEVLANQGINVTATSSELFALYERLGISVQSVQTGGSLVR